MPSSSIPRAGELTPEDRRRQIATILVEAVVRHRIAATRAKVGQFSPSRDTGLEVVSETRLSVSRALALDARDPQCEVNDGRNA